MGSRTLDARLDAVRAELEFLTSRIAAAKQLKEHEAATGWETWGRNSDAAFSFAVRRQLRGHFGKVYALDWGGDSSSLVSASQDGKLIVWNAFTENKQEAISLKSAWVMACAFEREEQRYVASGGLDNVCTVHDLRSPSMPAYELVGHAGYLSSCRWIGASHMLTGSGDGTCALWDTERGLRVQSFAEHTADVMSVSTHPETPHVFASGSCDATVKIWDVRVGGCVRTFTGACRRLSGFRTTWGHFIFIVASRCCVRCRWLPFRPAYELSLIHRVWHHFVHFRCLLSQAI